MELRVWKCEIPWLILNVISLYSLTNTPIVYLLQIIVSINILDFIVWAGCLYKDKAYVRLGWFIKEFLLKLQSKTKVYLYP